MNYIILSPHNPLLNSHILKYASHKINIKKDLSDFHYHYLNSDMPEGSKSIFSLENWNFSRVS